MCWDHGGDPGEQIQAARTALGILALSAGTPMLAGGSEFYRTQNANNNPFNLDTIANWFDCRQPRNRRHLRISPRTCWRSGWLTASDGPHNSSPVPITTVTASKTLPGISIRALRCLRATSPIPTTTFWRTASTANWKPAIRRSRSDAAYNGWINPITVTSGARFRQTPGTWLPIPAPAR